MFARQREAPSRRPLHLAPTFLGLYVDSVLGALGYLRTRKYDVRAIGAKLCVDGIGTELDRVRHPVLGRLVAARDSIG